MKNQQGAPEALRLADLLRQQAAYHREVASDCDMRAENTINWGHGEVCCRAADELLRLHAYCQELEAQVILDCMTHGQQSAEIEHVVGDVSKNGAESNMAQQPAPSAAAAEAVVVYEQKENEMQVWFRPARMHGHPERTPIKATITKDRGNGIVDLTYDDGEFSGNARAVPNALRLPRNVREQVAVWWDVGFEMDFQTAVDNSLKKKKDDPPPQPAPSAAHVVAAALADSQYLAGVSAGWNAANADDPNSALQKLHESRAGYLKPLSAARAPADSVLEDAARWFAERDNVLQSFWVLLGEAEAHADNDNNPLLKHQVEGFYRQWNALNGTTLGPRWVTRAARKQGGA